MKSSYPFPLRHDAHAPPPAYDRGLSRRVSALVCCCVSKGFKAEQWFVCRAEAMWRIKLAAVVYRLSPTVHLLYSAPYNQAFRSTPPLHPQTQSGLLHPLSIPILTSLMHTVLNSCNIHWQPSHDTIFSVQPLLPRVLWLPSMQISHVLIVVFVFIEKGKKRR